MATEKWAKLIGTRVTVDPLLTIFLILEYGSVENLGDLLASFQVGSKDRVPKMSPPLRVFLAGLERPVF